MYIHSILRILSQIQPPLHCVRITSLHLAQTSQYQASYQPMPPLELAGVDEQAKSVELRNQQARVDHASTKREAKDKSTATSACTEKSRPWFGA